MDLPQWLKDVAPVIAIASIIVNIILFLVSNEFD